MKSVLSFPGIVLPLFLFSACDAAPARSILNESQGGASGNDDALDDEVNPTQNMGGSNSIDCERSVSLEEMPENWSRSAPSATSQACSSATLYQDGLSTNSSRFVWTVGISYSEKDIARGVEHQRYFALDLEEDSDDGLIRQAWSWTDNSLESPTLNCSTSGYAMSSDRDVSGRLLELSKVHDLGACSDQPAVEGTAILYLDPSSNLETDIDGHESLDSIHIDLETQFDSRRSNNLSLTADNGWITHAEYTGTKLHRVLLISPPGSAHKGAVYCSTEGSIETNVEGPTIRIENLHRYPSCPTEKSDNWVHVTAN